MDKSNNQVEKLYTFKEIAVIVEETPNVVRNWFKELKSFIPHEKNDSGYNVFAEEGLERFKEIRQLHRERNLAIKQIEHYFATDGASYKPVPEKDTGEKLAEELNVMNEKLQALEDYAQRQENFNRALVERLEKQQQFIDRKLLERDNQLMTFIREQQETKMLMAAATEKRKWWEFWK